MRKLLIPYVSIISRAGASSPSGRLPVQQPWSPEFETQYRERYFTADPFLKMYRVFTKRSISFVYFFYFLFNTDSRKYKWPITLPRKKTRNLSSGVHILSTTTLTLASLFSWEMTSRNWLQPSPLNYFFSCGKIYTTKFTILVSF